MTYCVYVQSVIVHPRVLTLELVNDVYCLYFLEILASTKGILTVEDLVVHSDMFRLKVCLPLVGSVLTLLVLDNARLGLPVSHVLSCSILQAS